MRLLIVLAPMSAEITLTCWVTQWLQCHRKKASQLVENVRHIFSDAAGGGFASERLTMQYRSSAQSNHEFSFRLLIRR